MPPPSSNRERRPPPPPTTMILAAIEIIAMAIGFALITLLIDKINEHKDKKAFRKMLKNLGYSDKEIDNIINN